MISVGLNPILDDLWPYTTGPLVQDAVSSMVILLFSWRSLISTWWTEHAYQHHPSVLIQFFTRSWYFLWILHLSSYWTADLPSISVVFTPLWLQLCGHRSLLPFHEFYQWSSLVKHAELLSVLKTEYKLRKCKWVNVHVVCVRHLLRLRMPE
jgi:hypothetical protein